MHCGNTTFAYDNEFKDYMKVERIGSEDIFDYIFDVGVRKFLPEMNYLKNEIQSILSN